MRFGRERPYWISRLRAYAFSWAFSEQFEIGPISEASIGQIQRYCCAYGFVDHVITPNGGMAWMIAGDALDRFVTVPIENPTRNIAARIFARTALNPAQAFANLMSLQYPWHRENRATVSLYAGEMLASSAQPAPQTSKLDNDTLTFNVVPKAELVAAIPNVYQLGALKCIGGGGVFGVRLSDL